MQKGYILYFWSIAIPILLHYTLVLVMPKEETVKEVVELDRGLDERFRKAIAKRKGLHRGVIKEAFEEAIEQWIEQPIEEKVE